MQFLSLFYRHTMNHWALMLIIMMQALKCPMMVCAMLTGIAFLSRTDDATLSWTREKEDDFLCRKDIWSILPMRLLYQYADWHLIFSYST